MSQNPVSTRPEITGRPARLPAWSWLPLWLLVSAACFPVYEELGQPLRSDMYLHGSIVVRGLESGSMPGYTLLYPLLVWVVGDGVRFYEDMRVPFAVILSLFMGLKAVVTLWALTRARVSLALTMVAALVVLLVVPLDLSTNPNVILGKISGAIWHNSTTVMLAPVSVLLFFLAVDYLRRPARGLAHCVGIIVLAVLNLLVKPNFGMVYLPVFGIYSLWLAFRERPNAGWWSPVARYMSIAIPSVVVLLLQYMGTYADGSVEFKSTVDPLVIWSHFTDWIPLAVFESLLLPALATIAVWRHLKNRDPVVLAWCCLFIGVAMFAVLSEVDAVTGELVTHGNWSWGMQVAMYVLMVVLAGKWLRHRREVGTVMRWMVEVLAVVQAVWGVYYIVRLMTVTYM